jgi:protein SCO1/2
MFRQPHHGKARLAATAWLGVLLAALAVPALNAFAADEPAEATDAAAQSGELDFGADVVPDKFRNAKVQQNLDAKIPLGLTFTDHNGQQVELARYFNNDKPVVMALMYYRCPMLCGEVLNTMFNNLKQIGWTPGEQYEVVVISFDHREGTRLAKINQKGYAANFGRPGAGKGFHFHTSDKQPVRELADVLGFPYQFDEESGQFSHPAAVFVLTPEGRISKYLTGLTYKPRTMRLSMVEASNGRIGSFVDQAILLCSHYDDRRGYVASAVKIMNLSAPAVALGIVVAVVLVIRKARRARLAQWADADVDDANNEATSRG